MYRVYLTFLFIFAAFPLYHCVYYPNGNTTGLLGIPASYILPAAAICGAIQGIFRFNAFIIGLVLMGTIVGWLMSLANGPAGLAWKLSSFYVHACVFLAYLVGVFGPVRQLILVFGGAFAVFCLCAAPAILLNLP